MVFNEDSNNGYEDYQNDLNTSLFNDDETERESRTARLLNVFSIVRFPNDACNATGGNFYGTCYTATECKSLGGTSSGACASGFGVCCSLSGTCGGTTRSNNTYFTSSDSDTSPCIFSVCKASDDVCQIRLNFDTFDIAGPYAVTTTGSTNAQLNARGQCLTAQFQASKDGPAAPILCGKNSGYHMILEAQDACNSLTFTWTTSTTRTWNIHTQQILCTDPNKPPEGCLQYFTGLTGNVYSYNFQGGVHLANQDYNNCFRQEHGYCQISFLGNTFEMNNPHPGTVGFQGNSCSNDYIIIQEGVDNAATTTWNPSRSRFCGVALNLAPGSEDANKEPIISRFVPFQLGVYFDANERDANPPNMDYDLALKGFDISYTQLVC